MTDIREKFGPKFEALFLEGRDRSNPLVGSQLHTGADGEYFNSNTRNLWRYYLAGLEDGTANALDAETTDRCADGHMPIGWTADGATYCEVCSIKLEDEPAPEPSEPDHVCDHKGPPSFIGESTCSVCGHVWEFPF